MPTGPDISELVLKIHEVALEDNGWEKIARALMQRVGAEQALMLRLGGEQPTPWARGIEFDPTGVQDYLKHWWREDEWFRGAVRNDRVHTGLVSVDAQLVDRRHFQNSGYFCDFLRPIDVDRMLNVCLAAPSDSNGDAAALSFYRGLGKDGFSNRDAELLTELAPHLVIAARNYWRAQRLALQDAWRQCALDAIEQAVYAIDHDDKVQFTNRAGTAMLQAAQWVRSIKGVLHPANTLLEPTRLSHVLARLGKGLGFELLVKNGETGAEGVITGAPLPAGHRHGRCIAMLWITPLEPTADSVRVFARLFELTPAEARLVRLLTTTDDLREAAQQARISVHTARVHLKSVFRKSGRRSQARLLALISRLSMQTFRTQGCGDEEHRLAAE